MVRVEILPEADRELEDSARWYEEQEAGAGDDFIEEVERTIAKIAESPETWPFILGSSRRCLVHRFPYGVVYTYRQGTVRIEAVMHLGRRPGYWRHRDG
jgi:plasmid stabilization system protein ParE